MVITPFLLSVVPVHLGCPAGVRPRAWESRLYRGGEEVQPSSAPPLPPPVAAAAAASLMLLLLPSLSVVLRRHRGVSSSCCHYCWCCDHCYCCCWLLTWQPRADFSDDGALGPWTTQIPRAPMAPEGPGDQAFAENISQKILYFLLKIVFEPTARFGFDKRCIQKTLESRVLDHLAGFATKFYTKCQSGGRKYSYGNLFDELGVSLVSGPG